MSGKRLLVIGVGTGGCGEKGGKQERRNHSWTFVLPFGDRCDGERKLESKD